MKQPLRSRTITYCQTMPFKMEMRYDESDPEMPENRYESHIHSACEIYIHVSGDVSFMVENRLYPVQSGSVIITRPYEYHHCIYRSAAVHRHFCFFLSAEGNEDLFDMFYHHPAGENNLLVLPPEKADAVFSLCDSMIREPQSPVQELYRFFRLVRILEQAEMPDMTIALHDDVLSVINHINYHLSERIVFGALAEQAGVSICTLERHFREELNMTPAGYLRQKRLAKAVELLSEDNNVTETCSLCGFPDLSAFIHIFRETYGMTPMQFKKNAKQQSAVFGNCTIETGDDT